MKTKENITEQPEQELTLELLKKMVEELGDKDIYCSKDEEARKLPMIASEEVIRSIRENDERAKKSSSK